MEIIWQILIWFWLGFLSFCVLGYIFFKRAFSYWQQKGVPFIQPTIPSGNIGSSLIGKESLGAVVTNIYTRLKSLGYKHAGLYFISKPVYMPFDHDTIKAMLIKDFNNFMDHGVHFDEIGEPLSAHLFAIEGTKWKNLRAKLSPTFTSGKMKMMFQIVHNCASNLTRVVDKESKCGPVEFKDLFARYTIDVIVNSAYGLECNSVENPSVDFRTMGKKIFDQSAFQAAKQFIGFGFPSLAKIFKLKTINSDVSKYFLKLVEDTMNYRIRNNVKRNDFMDLLLQLHQKGFVDDEEKIRLGRLTINEAAAQAFVFFVGGSETSSTTMSSLLFEMAVNEEVQNRLRSEILDVLKETKDITYEALNRMKYLDMVINETLRKYPPVAFLNRVCKEDYYVEKNDITLEKGTMIYIPITGVCHDSENYPEPEKFDPERFNEENRRSRDDMLFIPFGEGPRICIGARFGLLQIKMGVVMLLRTYKLSLNPKTELPLRIWPKSFVQLIDNEIWLNVNKL